MSHLLEHFRVSLNRGNDLLICFVAFFSREPASTSLRNALGTIALAGAVCLGASAARSQERAPEAPRPKRIVSVNMCTDELLLRLAEKERIASVTWLSQDPRNANMADEAKGHPANHGLAEEVLSYRPDLVLAGVYTSRASVAMLRRVGLNVADIAVPRSLAEVRDTIRRAAQLLGETARGEALIVDMDRRLGSLAVAPGGRKPRAIVLRPNGFTAAKGSLVDDVISKAGLVNLAAELGYVNYAQVPLETLVLEGADVLIIDGGPGSGPALASEVLQHPVVKKLAGRLRVVSLPSRLWTCAGPAVVDAIEQLAAATRDLRVSPPGRPAS
ncbi:ABC transporter substrate-binding protein [Chelatococcus reniformis]|uniref:ABC transporter substrate-binding protein n=1 Tax=Chelatococcus reniformis TaxID=1494448 RepID=A0A916UPI6_9HYPH|nr:ABC transporter substrate-binding protein [Chelatococcus reniformis]